MQSIKSSFLNIFQKTSETIVNDEVAQAAKKIESTFQLVSQGYHEEAKKIFSDVRAEAYRLKDSGDKVNANKIEDKLFETALEFELKDEISTAITICKILDNSREGDLSLVGIIYHFAAADRLKGLQGMRFERSYASNQLKKLADDEERGLKVAPYFVATMFLNGSHGVTQNDDEAEKYFNISANRGYQPAKDYLQNSSPLQQNTKATEKMIDKTFATISAIPTDNPMSPEQVGSAFLQVLGVTEENKKEEAHVEYTLEQKRSFSPKSSLNPTSDFYDKV